MAAVRKLIIGGRSCFVIILFILVLFYNLYTNTEYVLHWQGEKNKLIRASVEYMDLACGNVCYHWLEYRYNLLGQIGPK